MMGSECPIWRLPFAPLEFNKILDNLIFADIIMLSTRNQYFVCFIIQEFLPTIRSLFTCTKWFGIPVFGGKKFLFLTLLIFSILGTIEFVAVWKLIRALAGLSVITDGRGVTARLSGSIFYASILLSLTLLWRLLWTWKSLSVYWLSIETKGLYLPPDCMIKRRVTFVTYFVMFCACVEHACSMVSAIGFDCPPSELLSQYVLNSHKFMLLPNQYNVWVGITVFIASKIATILWNFHDLTVILISMGLASRYHRLNLYVNRLVAYEQQQRRQQFYAINTHVQYTWRKLREAYAQQAKLVRKVDKALGALIILCNLNNFYFICLQLFLELRKSEGAILSRAYYFVSIGWLTFRASSVVLAAADVNLHSQRALRSVCMCPSLGYNIEVKRLKYYLINDYVCLTGMGLFNLNRHKLLEVAAAVVKYELILINFDT